MEVGGLVALEAAKSCWVKKYKVVDLLMIQMTRVLVFLIALHNFVAMFCLGNSLMDQQF